jgi:hypothetical protein
MKGTWFAQPIAARPKGKSMSYNRLDRSFPPLFAAPARLQASA